MKKKYSIFSIAKNALSGHKSWPKMWRSPEPREFYDVIIIGGGGHGLGTAYYLAKEHGLKNIAVIEKGWLGGGNTGRNTTIIRSNYLWDDSAHLYEHSLKLWENLSNDLNYNVMFSQRGVMNLAHNEHDIKEIKRRISANNLNGIDSLWLSKEEIQKKVPIMNTDNLRYPVLGASFQPRGGVARHDAVAWGFAMRADEMGVDIIQNCEAHQIKTKNGKIEGVETSKGFIRANKVGVVASGHTGVLAETAGVRLPLQSKPLQALVSEPIKPIIDTVVMSSAVHAYVSQSDKGELVIGAGTDSYNSFTQRGGFDVIEDTIRAMVELYPVFGKMKMLRQWGGIVDICPDASPIISKCDVDGLFFNCGWGTGGFKATPGSANVFAHTIAKNQPHNINAAFSLDRFVSGKLVDEHGAAAVAH
ncbi:sarcosine oxidase subunit beta family protein [Alphaproteobacteria bacterium]|nr:sarcosine oxidase subunit beta family protein [Alphaproteobacteria bacterium]MDB2636154.1 sarcosine oxidase subunit beta family protein [Alphaproteobacteria bacterium]MDC0594581.1 sarcosine oxidase subunit beta family protein [Alphaproteobacteria bacterium]MDC0967642.1 sarcosine oxidase subunit beta family protein [Alphaproteobacteria bacterium]